jgi:hypothetical protein
VQTRDRHGYVAPSLFAFACEASRLFALISSLPKLALPVSFVPSEMKRM